MYYSVKEYLELPRPDQVWVWEGILPASGAALLYAKQKVGKSFLALGLAAAVADSDVTDYLGQPVKVHGRVLYIQLDTPRALWIKNYLGNVWSSAAQENIYVMDREMDDFPMPFDIREPKSYNWVLDAVARIKPVMVIIDTFRRVHKGKENDGDEMQAVYEAIVRLAAPAAILLLTHEKKAQEQGAEASVRGSTTITASVDCIIHMTKKRLKFEARSDIEEELPIFQMDSGMYSGHSSQQEVDEYIETLAASGAKSGDITKQLVEKYKVSESTARRWKKKG